LLEVTHHSPDKKLATSSYPLTSLVNAKDVTVRKLVWAVQIFTVLPYAKSLSGKLAVRLKTLKVLYIINNLMLTYHNMNHPLKLDALYNINIAHPMLCFAGIRHCRYMFKGRPFTIYTDHKPLTYALDKVADGWTAMQCRQLSYVAEFRTDIRHVPDVDNVVADTLSRPPTMANTGPGSCHLHSTWDWIAASLHSVGACTLRGTG